jgi:predicted signal transduction protein with EAL and GGDEF domain
MTTVPEETTRFQPLVCTRTGFVSGWDPLPAVEGLPAFARFDPVLIADIDRQSVKFNLVEALLRHTRRLGVRTIAGDVTRRGELDAVVALGIDLVQGPRLCGGVPRPSRSDMLAAARAVLDAHLHQADGRSSCAGCGAD